MNSKAPTVSIVIPVKGRSNIFKETVQSLLAQTCQDWEAIIVDDRSPGKEFQNVSAIVATDSRMRLVVNRGRAGACACRNAGLAASAGKFVVFLDSDDLLAPTCLEKRIETLEKNPDADFAVFLSRIFHNELGDTPYLWNEFLPDDDIERFLQNDPPWGTLGPIWRRERLVQMIPWNERARSWQDWEFHISAIASGAKYIKVSIADTYVRAKQTESITSTWDRPRFSFNRVRVMQNVAARLRSKNALTKRRRNILAALFLQHAFLSKQQRSRALKIWSCGRRAGVVNPFAFAAVLISRSILSLVGTLNRRLEKFLFPDLSTIRSSRRRVTGR